MRRRKSNYEQDLSGFFIMIPISICATVLILIGLIAFLHGDIFK